MKKLLSILALIVLIVSCKSKYNVVKPSDSAQANTENQKEAIPSASKLSIHVPTWPQSCLRLYMAITDNKLIRQAHKEGFFEDLVYDNTLKTDSAVYDTYRIGHDVATKNNSDERFVVDQWIYVDTASKQFYEYDALSNKLKKWWTIEEISQLFYPVYELSPKTIAFVVNFMGSEQSDLLNALFNKYCPEQGHGLKVFDTSGRYKLFKGDAFEKTAKKYFDKDYYVYGTKGYVKTRVKEVVVGLDKCMTNIFAFCLDNAIIRSVGHPIFCSTKYMEITNTGDYSGMEKSFNELTDGKVYYTDSMKIKVFGQVGNCYITYHDDFLWGQRQKRSTCKFPGRNVWGIEKNDVAGLWNGVLDLYGISCN